MENKPITIEYSNHFYFEGRRLAFRKKFLFDITGCPLYIKESEQGYWFGRKLLTKTKAKELIKHEPIVVDVTDLQWYIQIQLAECFNLEL